MASLSVTAHVYPDRVELHHPDGMVEELPRAQRVSLLTQHLERKNKPFEVASSLAKDVKSLQDDMALLKAGHVSRARQDAEAFEDLRRRMVRCEGVSVMGYTDLRDQVKALEEKAKALGTDSSLGEEAANEIQDSLSILVGRVDQLSRNGKDLSCDVNRVSQRVDAILSAEKTS